MLTFDSNSESDTDRIGRAIAESVPPGTTIGVIGTLGAGKTRLVQAVAMALGNPAGTVSSPTFVLVNEYKSGRIPIYHFDTYRIKDEDEFLALGPDEYFEAAGITFVEWADRFAELLPAERLTVTIEVTGESERRVSLDVTSDRLNHLLEQIQSACTLS